MSASVIKQPIAGILLKLAYEDRFSDHDLRIFLALDAAGVVGSWIPVNQRKLSQVLSSGGRLVSRRIVSESLKRLTAGDVLQKEGRKYRAILPSKQPHETRG